MPKLWSASGPMDLRLYMFESRVAWISIGPWSVVWRPPHAVHRVRSTCGVWVKTCPFYFDMSISNDINKSGMRCEISGCFGVA